MLVHFLRKHRISRDFIFRLGQNRGKEFANIVAPYLSKGQKVLDVGTGTGNVCLELHEKGYLVTPLDIENLSFTDKITPQLYDGDRLPYKDREFHTSLLLTVLHHIEDPIKTLEETARVSGRVIIIEDIYKGRIHKYVTFFGDSLFNLEFLGHPHSNKTDVEWKKVFSDKNYTLKEVRYARSFVIFKHAIYVLDTI